MPEKTLQIDFARFNSAGFGIIYGITAGALSPGEVIAVTDLDADVVEAEVVDVCGDAATVHVHWDRVLHKA